MSETAWEGRRRGEPTAEYLGRTLESYLGFADLAERARLGHFDDYFCPEELADGREILRLVSELTDRARATTSPHTRRRTREVIEAVKQGEFDGTAEESQRWMASRGGQEALAELPPALRAQLFGA